MAKELITYQQYMMGRDVKYLTELTDEIRTNAQKLITRVNLLLNELGIASVSVSSGWRPAAVNSKVVGAAANSKHQQGLAVDLADADNKLAKLFTENLNLLQKHGLYLEDPRWTKTWCHLQLVAPKSGKRVFIPSTQPATNPSIWSGSYDKKLDIPV